MKHHDQYATKQDILVEQPRSVLTHRLLADIANDGGGDIDKAADGDPVPKTVRRSVEPTNVTDRGLARSFGRPLPWLDAIGDP
jgi:hypothetical protein